MPELRLAGADVGRVAMISMHTSPLEQIGTGDAGGMNVYVDSVAREMARRGVEVDVFSRAGAASNPKTVDAAPGYRVHHIRTRDGLVKDDLPGHLIEFTAGLLQHDAVRRGCYDLVHSHYWLSGQVGWVAANSWGVPLVHSMHTLARVKNAARAQQDRPEPVERILGEDQIVAASDLLVANTAAEATDLQRLYRADAEKVSVVHPGVDLSAYAPGDRAAERRRLGLPQDRAVLLFVGRLQPLKAPDLAIRALAAMVEQEPGLRDQVLLVVCGGPSGARALHPEGLAALAQGLGVGSMVRLEPPVSRTDLAAWYRAADLTVVPSYNESFGLVAVESQASGTPVVAASVGGLKTAVADGASGVLVPGHDEQQWGRVLGELVGSPQQRRRMGVRARAHASQFSWSRTADQLLLGYSGAIRPEALQAAAG